MASPTWRLVSLALCLGALAVLQAARGTDAARAFFVFGDSLVDNGNNNFIASMARANYPPYGIDFAGGPTGRFSNGLTTVDAIGKQQACCEIIVPPLPENWSS